MAEQHTRAIGERGTPPAEARGALRHHADIGLIWYASDSGDPTRSRTAGTGWIAAHVWVSPGRMRSLVSAAAPVYYSTLLSPCIKRTQSLSYRTFRAQHTRPV